MAKLYFKYGAMNSGKSTILLQSAHNYEERGMRTVIMKPFLDTKGADRVVSRLGVTRPVNYLVKADSCWFLTSMETGRPVRPTAEDIAPYPTVEPRLDMEDLPRKITLPENLEEVGRISVMKHHLDINRHVNNVQYVDIACEAVPEGCEICGIRAEYRKAAVLGDVIVLKCAVDGDKYAVSLCAEDGSIFANVELKTMK